MKTKPHTLKLAIIAIVFATTAFAQMNNWVMPPYRFKVNTSPVVPAALYTGAPNAGFYGVANGAYDQNGGGLLFYVKDYTIMNPNGTSTGKNIGTNGGGRLGGEIEILPVPGACRKFFVIYSYGNQVLFTKVDCTGSSVVVDNNHQTGPANNGDGYNVGYFTYDGTGLAASKKTQDPNGPGFIYYLYMVNSGAIYYSIVTSTGISTPIFMGQSGSISGNNTANGFGRPSTEVELSENGQYLAFNGYDDAVNFVNVTANVDVYKISNYTAASYYYTYTHSGAQVFGLELVGTGLPVLYVAGEWYHTQTGPWIKSLFESVDFTNFNQGNYSGPNITYLNPQSLPSHPAWQVPYGVSKSFLEYTKSGQLCYVCNYDVNYNNNSSRFFVEYDVNTGVFTPTQIDVTGGLDVDPNSGTNGSPLQWQYNTYNSNQNSIGVFTLPEQVDGEDYNAFTTTLYTSLDHVQVNQAETASPDENQCLFNEAYNCDEINVSAYFNVKDFSVCESSIDIHEVTANCSPLTGNQYFNCDNCGGEGLGNDHPWVVDIRHFTDVSNISLFNHTGYFLVTWNITDCCGNISHKTAHIRILGSVVNPVLQIFDNTAPLGAPNPWLPASTSIASPINVGSGTIGFQVPPSAGTGNITAFTTQIQEVDNTGAITGAGTVYNKTVNTNNINNIGPQPLNSLCVASSVWFPNTGFVPCTSANPSYSGYSGYWSFTNGQNCFQKYYKIKLTFSNPCSSSTAYSYVYVSSIGNKTGNITAIEQNQEQMLEPNIFPNPASNELFISGVMPGAEVFDFEMVDMLGKRVLNYSGKSGKDKYLVDVSSIPTGLYLWKYTSAGKSKVGKVEIMK